MKRGFTLIELMAVIVVLGVLATISIISVDKIIKENKEETYKTQIATIEDAARTWGVKHIKELPDNDGEAISVPLLYFRNEGIIPKDLKNPKTNKPFNDDLYVDISYEGGIYKYEVVEESGLGTDANPPILNRKYITTTKTYANGQIVYFNVTTGKKCSSSYYVESQSNTGVKEGCMKFYAFNDDGGDTLNLILDHNTTTRILWNSSGSSANGPKEALTQLKADTENWKGTETPTNYTIDQTGQTSNAKFTIDYSGYNARFITAQEVATITGNTSWNEKNAKYVFYFDTNTPSKSSTCQSGNISGCSYGWLYDRTSEDCTTYGCKNNSDKYTHGYWTASPRAESTSSNWCVAYEGYVGNYAVHYPDVYYGIRPVITISKSQL